MPAYSVTGHIYSIFAQALVILSSVSIMASGRGQIEATAGKELMRGALKSSDEETGKERLVTTHADVT